MPRRVFGAAALLALDYAIVAASASLLLNPLLGLAYAASTIITSMLLGYALHYLLRSVGIDITGLQAAVSVAGFAAGAWASLALHSPIALLLTVTLGAVEAMLAGAQPLAALASSTAGGFLLVAAAYAALAARLWVPLH